MKEQIQILIGEHKLNKQQAEVELDSFEGAMVYEERFTELDKEVELRQLFIQELEELLEQC
jgi:hypothetical protein